MILADCGESGSDIVAPDPGSPTAETPPITRSAAPPGAFADGADAAREYLARGYAPIPLDGPRTKKVTRPNWPHERYTPADVEAFRGRNIGLLLGPPSGGLTDVDPDCPEAIRAADVLLPKTAMVSGRRTARRSHHYYLCNPSPESLSLSDPLAAPGEKAKLVELRTGWNAAGPKGEQTMAPPSVHPDTGEVVMWEEVGEPAVVDAADLEKAVKAVAAAALIGRYWQKGNRHTAALALAGALLRAGWTVEDAERFMTAVCAAAQDEEVRDRVAAVRATARNLAEGKNATGWKRLAELLDGKVVARVREWLGIRDSAVSRDRRQPVIKPLPSYRPFPLAALPTPWDAFAREGARALDCDAGYVALPILAVLAGAIGMTRRVHLGGEWTEPAVVWAVDVGESGTVKSPAAELSQGLVAARQKRLHARYKVALTEYKVRLRAWKANGSAGGEEEPAPPVFERVLVGNITYEKLVVTLADNPRGLLRYLDEFAGFIASLTRYRATAASSDEADWLSIHRAGPVQYDRKSGDRTTVLIPHAAVSVLGTIQPGKLKDLLRPLLTSGFAARLLFAMPPRSRKRYVEDGIPAAVKRAAAESLDRLYDLAPAEDEDGTPQPVVLPLTADARRRWKRFVDEWGGRQFEADGEVAAALAKLEGYAARFALIHHLASGHPADGEGAVPLASVEAGIAITEWAAHEMIRVYRLVGEADGDARLRTLAEAVTRLARKHGTDGRLKPRDLARSRSCTTAEAEDLLEELVAAGVGRWEPGGGDPGRGGKVADVFVLTPTTDNSDGPPDGDDRDTPDDGPDAPPDLPPSGDGEPTGPAVTSGSADSGSNATPGSGAAGLVGHVGLVGCRAGAQAADGNVGAGGYTLVADPADLPAAVEAVAKAGVVGLRVEATGPTPRDGTLRLVQIATPTETLVIDAQAVDLAPMLAALGGVEVVGHDLVHELSFLMPLGFAPGRVYDTMLASQVLDAGDGSAKLDLTDVCQRHLGVSMGKGVRSFGRSGSLTAGQLRYAARCAAMPLRLGPVLAAALASASLTSTVDLENRTVPAVAWMAGRGVAIDRPAWEALATAAVAEAAALAAEMNGSLPAPVANWNSTAQVKAAFAALRITLASTADDVLATVNHPLADLLRRYRSATKYANTYGVKWLGHVVADGRAYPNWYQNATATGRMSCSGPNMQNLPRDPRYRRCVVAPPGRVLVKADYSQIELRIAAALSNETTMIAAYLRGDDLHAITASAVLGKPIGDVTEDDRKLAKAVNFGLVYGGGAEMLAGSARQSRDRVSMTVEQATAYRAAFFRAYPGLAVWHRRQGNGDGAIDTRTRGGRRRLGVQRYTEKLNSPVQGTAADGLKAALALLWERRAGCPSAVPVLAVHDEIVVECDAAEADAVAGWLERAMVDGMTPFCAPVPVVVKLTVAPTWGG